MEPGCTHDLTSARLHALPARYRAARGGVPTLADKAYTGAGAGIRVPVRRPGGSQVLDRSTRGGNSHVNAERAFVEHGIAHLKTRWRACTGSACAHGASARSSPRPWSRADCGCCAPRAPCRPARRSPSVRRPARGRTARSGRRQRAAARPGGSGLLRAPPPQPPRRPRAGSQPLPPGRGCASSPRSARRLPGCQRHRPGRGR
ncbi:hypothetical protein GTR00_01370 [Kineococcus sp. T90]|nr:hypothetical protein [Kineococcus indalonis]